MTAKALGIVSKYCRTAPSHHLLSVPLQVILTDEYISGAFGSLGIL